MPDPMIPITVNDGAPGVVSVLFPSRHRLDMLTRSVASLRDTAADPEALEILVAYDPDDPGTGKHAASLGAAAWEAPERFGYFDIARYYAALIEESSGEWLLPTWGDDGLMTTYGWDDLLRGCPKKSIVYVDGNFPGLTCFPAVHRDVFKALSRISPLPASDTWYEDVGRAAGILVHPERPIYVMQDRFDLTGNNNDELYRESRAGYRRDEYYSVQYQQLRAEDAIKIKDTEENRGVATK